MSFLRWILTFLAFPVGGFFATMLVGPAVTPLAALAAGLVAGAVIGAAQWLALGRIAGWRWMLFTAAGMSIGSGLAVMVIGPLTSAFAGATAGLLSGALVGLAQGALLRRGWRIALLWSAVLSVTWAVGWFVTSLVIVDIEAGHIVFGSSGAAVVTVVTGVVLRLILGRRPSRAEGRARGTTTAADSAESVAA